MSAPTGATPTSGSVVGSRGIGYAGWTMPTRPAPADTLR
jgi:hypothetical protein